LAVIEYSIDCRMCQTFCGAIGNGRSPRGNWRCSTSGSSIGVGFPMISVSRPTMLWK
jgi:hypothetical protein